MRVLVFGASTAQGYWDTQGGWADRLKIYYFGLQMQDFSKDIPKVINLGISDDTTEHILKRLKAETDARQNAKGVSFIIQVGSNNAATLKGKPRSTPELYKSDLIEIINIAKQYSEKIIVVGFPAVDEARTNPLPWADMNFKNDDIIIYENAAAEVCEELNVPFVPVHSQFTKLIGEGKNLWSHDGLHPNDQGHQLIFELVRPVVDEVINT